MINEIDCNTCDLLGSCKVESTGDCPRCYPCNHHGEWEKDCHACADCYDEIEVKHVRCDLCREISSKTEMMGDIRICQSDKCRGEAYNLVYGD